jgi:hypothetical protein
MSSMTGKTTEERRMSDDLVKREWGRTLRNGLTDLEKMLGDRVEALTAELAEHAENYDDWAERRQP